nr:nascent polypeptide-associated complex subunit alpha isoform X1 [Oryctolagus cuniculus]
MPGEATETVPATEQELPQPQAETAMRVTAALGQPGPALPPPGSLAPQQCPLATANQPSPFPPPSAIASTPFEVPFPQSSSGTALPLGTAPDTPVFLPNLIGPPISPAALALASPMIAPTLKGAHSPSAPLALVALAPHSVPKSSTFPPLSSPPAVAVAESGSVTSKSGPTAPESKTSPIQIPPQGVPNPKGIASALPSNLVTPLASVPSGVASCPQTPPATPLTITSQVTSSALTSPQNPVNLPLKEPVSPPAALPFSTQSIPVVTSSQKTVAPSSPSVFPTMLGSHLGPLHPSSSVGSPVQPLGQREPNDPCTLRTTSLEPSSGASYLSHRSAVPPLPSRNEPVTTLPTGAAASPLAPSVNKGPIIYSPSDSPDVTTSSLSPTSPFVLKGSPNATQQQPFGTQILPSSGTGIGEAPISSVGTSPFVMTTNPSTISAAPTTFQLQKVHPS